MQHSDALLGLLVVFHPRCYTTYMRQKISKERECQALAALNGAEKVVFACAIVLVNPWLACKAVPGQTPWSLAYCALSNNPCRRTAALA